MRLKVNNKRDKNSINASKVPVIPTFKRREEKLKKVKSSTDFLGKLRSKNYIDRGWPTLTQNLCAEEASLELNPQYFGPGTQ